MVKCIPLFCRIRTRFANALIYYGISLLLPTMSKQSVHLAFFISGAVEIPGYIIAQLSLMYAGRKYSLCVTMLVGGTALLCTMAVPDGGCRTLFHCLYMRGRP